MRKVRTKAEPEGHVIVPIPIYRRLQALAISSNRSEAELLAMAIRLLATAVSRVDNFKLPTRDDQPIKKSKRSTAAPIGGTVKTIVNKLRRPKR